jgi:hypothetical protein
LGVKEHADLDEHLFTSCAAAALLWRAWRRKSPTYWQSLLNLPALTRWPINQLLCSIAEFPKNEIMTYETNKTGMPGVCAVV